MKRFTCSRVALRQFAVNMFVLIGTVYWSSTAVTPVAATPGPLFESEVRAEAASDLKAALSRIDIEIGAAASSDPIDERLLANLIRLKADLLIEAEQFAEAAGLLEELAGYVASHRVALGDDPVPLIEEAAGLRMKAGQLRRAERLLVQSLEEQTASGIAADSRRALLERLADVADKRGDGAAAQKYRDAVGQVTEPDGQKRVGARGDDEAYTTISVYYATDRARTGSAYPAEFYGGERGDLDYGVAEVTIPATHRFGAVEAPSIWLLEFSESPAKHVVLKSVEPSDKDAFFARMQKDAGSERKSDEAFVFVHGFNVSFENGAKRVAQLAHDMSFNGIPILYSWPSRGSVFSYIADTAVVRLSGRRLSRFLEDVAARAGVSRIHLIAHSMGNRALTDALELMATRRGQADKADPVFEQVVFAAPDLDAGLFAAMIESIRPLAKRLTLYASEEDWALKVSRKLHGNAIRAGQGGEEMLAVPVLDSIDMSALGEDMLAHAYFADDSSALVDLLSLFWRNAAPESRCGLKQSKASSDSVPVWQYAPNSCENKTMLPLLALLRKGGVEQIEKARELLRELIKDPEVLARVEPAIVSLMKR